MTDAERLVWQHVRNRRLNGHKFRSQWTLGPYVVDFFCWEANLIIELDGGQHTPEVDAARTNWLEAQGYVIRRFWNHDVMENLDGVLQVIASELAALSPREGPHPSPLPRAGEGA